jgi:RNA polymerase sigma factor (sigma-70 family)
MKADTPGPAPRAGAFPSTHWSIVVQAGADSEGTARAALEILCRQYWYPLYAFVRRQGRPHHEAEDLTQEFLARLVAGAGLAHARPERGRFRTFLLTSLRHFLTNEWHRAQAEKRGGGQTALSLDLERAEERFAHEPVDPGLTPEQAFDRSWALELLHRAAEALRDEYDQSGRGPLFGALGPLLWHDPADESLSSRAARLGMGVDAFSVALHRLRRRFGERLRAIVAETVADAGELDAELRHLIAVVADRGRDSP